MKNLSELNLTERLFGCIIGAPGSGKTVGLASFPGPICWFDFDGRMKPVKKMFPDRTDIEYETYRSGDFEVFKRDLETAGRNKRYKTYVFDSLLTLGEMFLQYSMGLRGGRSTSRSKGVMTLLEVEDYGVESQGLVNTLDFMRGMEHAHVFLTAHWLHTTAYDVVAQKEVTQTSILTGGKKIAAKIPALFDEVWSTRAEPGIALGDQTKYLLYTVPTSGIPFAKTALPLPSKIDFTMPKSNLWEQLQASLKR